MSGPLVIPGYSAKPRLIRAAYLAPGETVLKETRATRLYYLPGPIFWLLVVALVEYARSAASWHLPTVPGLSDLLGRLTSSWTGWFSVALSLLALVLVLWLAVRLLEWSRTVYAVTTNRIIVQRGIVSRDFDEIPVTMVRAVEVHQTAFDRIFRLGTIRLTSEGQNPIANEAWRGVPHPWDFQKLVDAAAQKYNRPPGTA